MKLEEKLNRSRSTERIDFSKYQSVDLNDPLVEIKTSATILVEPCWTIEDDWDGIRYRDYIAKHPEYNGVFVRAELESRLQIAAGALDKKYRLVIRAGHRPMGVQRTILIDCANDYKEDHPGVTAEEALKHARDFVSDPDLSLPPHVCGAAVDVEIIDAETGKLLDFGSKINDDTEESYLYYPNLTEKQKSNRSVLTTVMLDAGLASCMPEWWHFSYGDQIWAWFYGKENSLYSPVDI